MLREWPRPSVSGLRVLSEDLGGAGCCGGHFSVGLWVCSGRSEYQVKGVVKRNKAEGVEGLAESVSYRSVGWCGSAQGVAKGPEWRAESIRKGALVQDIGVRITWPRPQSHSPECL